MKKSIIFIIFISLFIHLEAQMLITTAQMNNINSSQSAFEGQIYKNTETNIFYIGLSGGTLKTIGELNTISSNASLTGDGTSGSPLGIAPMGASTGQALVWNGTSWAPSSVASGSTTVSNTVNGFQFTTTVNGVTSNPVSLPFAADGVAGLIALSCDLTGTVWCPRVANNAITSAKIQNSTIINEDLSSSSVSSDNIIDGTIITQDIANSQITFAKMQNISGIRLLGNPNSSVGPISEIQIGSGLSLSGSTLQSTAGTVTSVSGTSPITVSNGTTTPNISITRRDLTTGSSNSSSSAPLVLSGGYLNSVVGSSDAVLTINNTAPLWNANQLRGRDISYNTPTNGQVLAWNGSAWTPTDITTPTSNKKMVLSAEYAGAVIVPGSGTNHIGDMIGGNTGNNSPRYMNYYEWKGRSSSGIQTYQIILRITLPNDFTEWLNNAIVINYLVNSGCNLQLSLYNLSNTLLNSQTLYSSGWSTTTIWASSLSSWITPGETVALIITLSSTNNNVVRIGDIILNYK